MTKQDWHPADIIAALHKRGTSLAALSREAGLASSTLANALTRPWPKGEWLIATALNVHPATIWPTRYNGQEEYRLPKQPLPGMKIVAPRPCFPVPEKR
ncbi:helix-turn-helix domain-containing protein [Salmonella enterica]|uniref:Transcriptional regulator n=1 Tax=Salmonella enterica TaxID=28901 RepID=A0A633Q2J0_SALER|nr:MULTISPECIES: helix-turn-helix transcriptional regulator [Enterobacteriaceae]EAW9077252.1 transcriptional regulator [Salmonella enterica]EBQ9002217.1 transcriptional regulator [Salmonella enterica subsp. enterica serovar Blockley]EBY9280776.1 transcriptional regulator [Salmonella enterica subsp. enterica serovar Denver]ECD1119636.1 transcriptional regulator [Salmonella enterica subsp. enterica serovar Oakland]ECS8311763.1 transcriptional regulator [Salmonella enterica subsp. enterica serova